MKIKKFKRSTFVGSAWSFGFFILATTANVPRLRKISIPDFYQLHYYEDKKTDIRTGYFCCMFYLGAFSFCQLLFLPIKRSRSGMREGPICFLYSIALRTLLLSTLDIELGVCYREPCLGHVSGLIGYTRCLLYSFTNR